MAYTINRTDGTAIATITDGTIDTSTSLTLFGKSYSGFGELLNEDLVKLLENSASTSAPTAPLKGELWFDTSTGQLKVYDGTAFEPTGGSQPSATAPTSPSIGDLWIDTDDDQVYVYSGNSLSHQTNDKWELIGPVFTKGQTLSGFKIETLGSSGGNKVVSSMYAGNTRVAILSKEAFTPSTSQTGFATVSAGLTLNSTLGAVFSGSTTSASAIDVSGTTNTSGTVIAGGNFLRADAADTTTGALTIDNDTGILIGDESELTISVSSGHVTVAQTSQDKDLSFTINDGGSTVTPLKFTGSTGAVTIVGNVDITGTLTVSGEYDAKSVAINTYDDAFIKLNNGNSETDSGVIVETGDSDDARLFYDVSEDEWVAGEGGTYSALLRKSDLTDDGDANKGTKPLTTDSSTGNLKVTTLTLAAVGSISEGDTSNTNVPTIGSVVTFGDLWGGSAKIISTSQPTSGDGDNGDFFFVREA